MKRNSNKSIIYRIAFFILVLIATITNAQYLPLGTWTAHVPLSSPTSICQSKDYVYAACRNGVVGVNIDNGLLEKYTKVNGLAEVFVTQVGYDTATSTLVIVYQNSNIDLIQKGKVINIPYLKNAAIVGDKNIYSIFCTNGIAYLGTGFGLLKVDLVKNEISETYTFNSSGSNLRTNAVWANNDNIFCATTKGILMGRIAPNVNLLNFNNWVQYASGIPQNEASAITNYQGKVIAAISNTLYQFDGTSWSTFFTESNWITTHLNNSNGQLLIAQYKVVSGDVQDKRIGTWNGATFDFLSAQFNIERPLQILKDKNVNFWHADEYRGLIFHNGNNLNTIIPNAPYDISSKEMDFVNGTLWVASSSIKSGWNPVYNRSGFYKYQQEEWQNYNVYNYSTLDSLLDISVVKAIPNEDKILFGAHYFGLFEFSTNDNTFKIIKYPPAENREFRLTGADADQYGNVWMSNAYSSNAPLVCRKSNGGYVYFKNGFISGSTKLLKDVLVDDYNQIWIAKSDNIGGITVLNYGNDIDDQTDDQYFNLAAGSGFGNLPTNNITCLAKDKDGIIWLGSTQGISIISCAGYVTDNACEAEQICIDRKDGSGFCDNLLEDEIINCITVDAGNRKWIGTNNGIFLVSADGTKTIHYFNETNSPLLSNSVRCITINQDNGDVFIGTEKGICSYRAEATNTTENTEEPYVYPNPVTSEYIGLIAVKGIPNNCNVKFVDVSGNLVFETTAIGGQATWNGQLINGERAATGVYFALCQGSGKKEKAKLKFVLIH